MIEVPLTKGYVALVDDEDYEYLCKSNWYVVVRGPTSRGKTIYARCRKVWMHRFILECMLGRSLNKDEHVDHINRDGLDNRRINLRLATPSDNRTNRDYPVGVSGYRGVYRQGHKWAVILSINGKDTRFGAFATPKEAALHYNIIAIQYHGEFAILNDV
jgi:hypothetical protein